MAFEIKFNEEKNQLLKATRGIGFDEVVVAISEGNLLDDLANTNKKYRHQRMCVVGIGEYAYVVPYVIDKQNRHIFLKTVYPSRVLTTKYIKRR